LVELSQKIERSLLLIEVNLPFWSIKIGGKVAKEPTQKTGVCPVIRKLIRDEWERLRENKITPWNWLNSGKPMHVIDFYGKEINYQGGAGFEGSPQTVFWGRYIEPFLEDIILRALERTLAVCRDEGHEPKAALTEAGILLHALVRDAYNAMADVDQRLRGRGYPNRVGRRNVDGHVAAMGRFIDMRVNGLLAVARPSLTRFQKWKDYWANHRLVAVLLLGFVVITGLGSLTENASKLRVFARTWLWSSSEKMLVTVRVQNAGPAAEIDPLCEFYLIEDAGAFSQEYPKGRARLKSLAPTTGRGDYSLADRESREYELEVPNLSTYRALLERGAANSPCVVPLAGSPQFAVGSMPFQSDLLRSNPLLVVVNQKR